MPHLVQILLPVNDNEGRPLPAGTFAETRTELTERFGGLTAYMRAPARGLWKSDHGGVDRDDIVIFEIMAETIDRRWWQAYRETLRARFGQDELVIRSLAFEPL